MVRADGASQQQVVVHREDETVVSRLAANRAGRHFAPPRVVGFAPLKTTLGTTGQAVG